MFILILFVVAVIALICIQQCALRKYRRGFSLHDDRRPRRKLFADPEEQRMQAWLESDTDEPMPLDEETQSP